MQYQSLPSSAKYLSFDNVVPKTTSTRHVAAAAFYHCLGVYLLDRVLPPTHRVPFSSRYERSPPSKTANPLRHVSHHGRLIINHTREAGPGIVPFACILCLSGISFYEIHIVMIPCTSLIESKVASYLGPITRSRRNAAEFLDLRVVTCLIFNATLSCFRVSDSI